MLNIATVALGGALGSVARYYLSSSALKHFMFFDVPLAILIVNIFGSFMFGVFMGLIENNILISASLKTFLLTGFLASFTTFSTFAWESVIFIQNDMYVKLFMYCFLSLILSIAFCLAGYHIGK